MKAIVAKDVTIVWGSEIKAGSEVEVEQCGTNRYRIIDTSVDTNVWGECEVPAEYLELCNHDRMEMFYSYIPGEAVKEPIGEYCPDCGYSPDGLAIAIRSTCESRYDVG